MQRHRIMHQPRERVGGQEPAILWVHVPRPEVVEADIGIVLLAGVEVVIGRRAR